jgi:hypothetical protein
MQYLALAKGGLKRGPEMVKLHEKGEGVWSGWEEMSQPLSSALLCACFSTWRSTAELVRYLRLLAIPCVP